MIKVGYNILRIFFDTLYKQLQLNENSIIADIGCGTGKITANFIDRGNITYAVEPDKDMLSISDKRLGENTNYYSLNNPAETTGIPTNKIDMIFCGNAYHWFDRTKVIPEFNRILKSEGYVVLSNLGPGENILGAELWSICMKYAKEVPERKKDISPAFQAKKYIEGQINFIVSQDIEEFLAGCFSASYMPQPNDIEYKKCNDALTELFCKYSVNYLLDTNMQINYVFGKGYDLI